MRSHHWFSILVVAVAFYLIGAKWPQLAARVGVSG